MILTLGERDLYLLQIETEINNKKKLLLKKKRDLDKKQQLNHFLNGVTQDYQKYYNYILNEKQQQYKMLMILKEYLNDLIKTEHLIDEHRRTAKHDQKHIIREIDKVKVELDDLIKLCGPNSKISLWIVNLRCYLGKIDHHHIVGPVPISELMLE